MKIQMQPMGPYQTNCYIATVEGKDFIIDPGVGALEWVKAHVTNPVAILNTHGHFDHVWSNQAVKEAFDIPIYCPRGDEMFLEEDPFSQGTPVSHPDHIIEGSRRFNVAGVEIEYLHFPGHTPGCSMVRIGDAVFSGDFIFENSIGRWDFPFSSAEAMKESLERFQKLEFDAPLYPGHGNSTTIAQEQRNTPFWLNQF
jgi:hydroxyacylglutathione hydrolase